MRNLSSAEITSLVDRFRTDMAVAAATPGFKGQLAYCRCAGNLMALRGQTSCGITPEDVLPLLSAEHPCPDITKVFLKETYPRFQIPGSDSPKPKR